MARYSSEAYDLSLFEEHRAPEEPAARWDNAVPERREERPEHPRENVVELPERELKRNARPKRHPVSYTHLDVYKRQGSGKKPRLY